MLVQTRQARSLHLLRIASPGQPDRAQEVFKRLNNAQYRRLVILSEGSHAISHEKNRMHLIREVQHFLEEPAR